MKKNQISKFSNILLNIFFIILAITCVYPFLLVVSVSFSDENSLITYGYNIIPKVFSTEGYQYILKTGDAIFKAYGVSIFVTIVGTFLSVLIILLFAYPLSRKEFKYRTGFAFFLFFTMLFSGGMVPWYIVCKNFLHLSDTIFALFVPYLFNAFYVIITRTFLSTSIPDSLIESARIDGSGEFNTFFKIVVPLAKPAIATVALFSTLGFWNDWWLPLMLINNNENLYNMQYIMYRIINNINYLRSLANQGVYISGDGTLPSEGARMALCIISIGPIIFAYPFFQKFFVKGLTIGAIKG